MASYETFTIASSGTTSNALLVGKGRSLTAIEFPGSFTGTKVTLYGSVDGTNYRAIYLDEALVEPDFAANRLHVINPRATYNLHSVKLVSDDTEASSRAIIAIVDKVI